MPVAGNSVKDIEIIELENSYFRDFHLAKKSLDFKCLLNFR